MAWLNIRWDHVCGFEFVQKSDTSKQEFSLLCFENFLGNTLDFFPKMSTPGVPEMSTPGVQ